MMSIVFRTNRKGKRRKSVTMSRFMVVRRDNIVLAMCSTSKRGSRIHFREEGNILDGLFV